VNLHELHRIMRKTCENQRPDRGEVYTIGKESLFPVLPVTSYDGFDIVFIDFGIVFADRIDVVSGAKERDHLTAADERNLGIRNQQRRKYGMCFTANGAFDTADNQHKRTFMSFHFTLVITVNVETSGVPAGTGKLVKLQTVYAGIIKILR